MSTLSYRFGYCLGAIAHRAVATLTSLGNLPAETKTQPAPSLLELCRTPSLVRKGVDLSQWYANNVSICAPNAKPKRTRKKLLPKRSSLDVFI